MTSVDGDMDCDSGVTDMTGSESVISDRSESTIIGSPPSSIIGDEHGVAGHSESGAIFQNTKMEAQSSRDSVLSPDSGIGRGQSFGAPLAKERMDSTTRTQDGANTRTKLTMGPPLSHDSVMSPDSGIGSRSGSGLSKDSVLPKEQVDSTFRTQEWINTSEFEVFVKTLEGKTVTIKVEEDEEVTSFRKKVQEKTNVPDCQQYLHTAEGRKLQDGERLNAYKIKKHSTIYCQGRLRGGQ